MTTKYLFTSFLFISSLYAMPIDVVVKNAIVHNNSLKQASLETQQSKELRQATKSKNYGRFDLIASYDHYNNARTLSPLTPMDIVGTPTGAYEIPATNDLFSTGVAYNVILFDGFAQRNSYKISDISYKNSIIKTKLAKEELIYNAKSLYISLLALQKQLEAQKLYTASKKALSKIVEESYALGAKSKLDLLKAQNAYQESLSNEQKMEANSDILKANIVRIMGGISFDKVEDISIVMKRNEKDSINISRLDKYKLAKQKNTIAEKKLKKTEAAYYPVVDFSAYYGYNFGPNATQNTTPPTATPPNQTILEEGSFNNENIWQVGIHLKWNLYDFGVKSSLAQKERLALNSAQLALNDVALDIEKNFKIAKSKLQLSIADYNAAKSQYELLYEIEKAEEIKYESNAITLDDLLDTQAKEKLALANMINAKYEYIKAKYYIEYLNEKGEK